MFKRIGVLGESALNSIEPYFGFDIVIAIVVYSKLVIGFYFFYGFDYYGIVFVIHNILAVAAIAVIVYWHAA
jgi:hypothetical protein